MMKIAEMLLVVILTTLLCGCGKENLSVTESDIASICVIEVESDEESYTWNTKNFWKYQGNAFRRSIEFPFGNELIYAEEYVLRGVESSVIVSEKRRGYMKNGEKGSMELFSENVDISTDEKVEILATTPFFTLVKMEDKVFICRYGKYMDEMEYEEYQDYISKGEWENNAHVTPDEYTEQLPYVFTETDGGFKLLTFFSGFVNKYSFTVTAKECEAYYRDSDLIYYVVEGDLYRINAATAEEELIEREIVILTEWDGIVEWATEEEEKTTGKILWSK